jgi:molecular chaperone GrpE
LSNAEIEVVLNDFRSWLEELPKMPPPAEAPPPVDLYTLVAQFTALRQEVNLQTRTARSQQELLAQTLEQIRNADQPTVAGDRQNGVDSETLLRPYVQSLIEAADVQFIAVREFGRVVETVSEAVNSQDQDDESMPEMPDLGWWARWCGAGKIIEQQQDLIVRLEERLSAIQPTCLPLVDVISKPLEGALAGLQMGLQRLDRSLEQRGLILIPALGRQFDPEQMEVLEGVANTDRPAGEVIEELRRGYFWNGRVFRAAQVRVAR